MRTVVCLHLLFVYSYRRPMASLAILADDAFDWDPTSFRFEALNCQRIFEFPSVKLLDSARREEDLL